MTKQTEQPPTLRARLEARKKEIQEEAEKMLAPYRAALGEVERMLKILDEEEGTQDA